MDIQFDSAALRCPKCQNGHMLPFQDNFSSTGSVVGIKGYVCSDPTCHNNIFYNKGVLVSYEVLTEKLQAR